MIAIGDKVTSGFFEGVAEVVEIYNYGVNPIVIVRAEDGLKKATLNDLTKYDPPIEEPTDTVTISLAEFDELVDRLRAELFGVVYES